MMSWQTFLAIGSGGFIGAVLRAYLNGAISHRVPHELPFGALGVNLIGSFIMVFWSHTLCIPPSFPCM